MSIRFYFSRKIYPRRGAKEAKKENFSCKVSKNFIFDRFLKRLKSNVNQTFKFSSLLIYKFDFNSSQDNFLSLSENFQNQIFKPLF